MSKIPDEVDSVQKLLDYFESHQTLWDKITMPFYRVRNFIREKWWEFRQRCQRFKRGFAWGDVWDMDAWFISTAKPMLEHLLKKHWGRPCNIENEEWEAILQEMIDCLELMDEDKAQAHLGIAEDDYSAESYKKSRRVDGRKEKSIL